MNKNISKYQFSVSQRARSVKLNQRPLLLWFTGLSGSGKSTLANEIELLLFNKGFSTYTLDGDNTRFGLNSDLGFSKEDRKENIRRISEVSKLMLDAGLIVCASFVSPCKKDRSKIKKLLGEENVIEIFVNTPLEVCEKRDVKGLYKKAKSGKILNFTGISDPYEKPKNPDIQIDTLDFSIQQSVEKIYKIIKYKLT